MMLMRYVFSAFILSLSFGVCAQKISGTVYTADGDLLPFATITVKGSSAGTSANNKANFSFSLEAGTYTLVCQHIGYAATEKTVTVKNNTEVIFILPEQKLMMKEVVVKSGAEDPAYEIIRQAIKKRNYYHTQVFAFSCDLYTKDLIKLRKLPTKIFGRKIPEEDMKDLGLDSSGKGIIYLSESISKIHKEQPDKFKMEVMSSRVSGSSDFGFTFPTFISLYTNNVMMFTERLNPRGFVSPIADAAIRYYKFKFLGTFWENGHAINSIQVTPRRLYEPLFSGIINITDGDWRIHSFDLTLTKTSQLEIMDTLRVSQMHVPVNKDTWRMKSQLLNFSFNQFKIDAVGNFLSVYSDYSVNPVFPKKFFDRIVIKYDTAVNKKTKSYWDSTRPVPLEIEEQQDYQIKDSIFQNKKDIVKTKEYMDSLNRKQGKIKPISALWNGINRTHNSLKQTYTWNIESPIKNLEYNTAEGLVLNLHAGYNTYLKKWKSHLSVEPNLRYGFSNTHLNAWMDIGFRTRDVDAENKLKRYAWKFSGGKRVSDFNKESPMSPLVNSISILFYGLNYAKTYENYFGNINFTKRFENGLRIKANALYEDRIPLENTTNFTFFKKDTVNISPNYPNQRISRSELFRHQAVIISFDISFKPGQKYIQFPNSKMSLGSKYPTFTLGFSKGLNNVLGSDVDFDKWKVSVNDDKNLKLAGLLKYKVGLGGFLNARKVNIQDFQHFNGNQSASASEYVNSFQLAKFYANSTTASFYAIAHLEHHFNGLLTNKIPYLRKLNWNLVAGSNTFYVNRHNNYQEVFMGLENILKIFRLDFVVSFENGKSSHTGLRIGAGGLIGGNIQGNRRSGRSISL